MKNNDIISDLSGVVAGTIVEASISTVAPGIGGILGGAVAGNLVEKVFDYVGKEIKQRFLSKREESRITNVMDLAKEKIDKNLQNNKNLRNDNFFKKHKKNIKKGNFNTLLIYMLILPLMTLSAVKWQINY